MCRLRILAVALAVLAAAGCQSTQNAEGRRLPAEPDYTRPLPPGTSALRLITDPRDLPDLAGAFRDRSPRLLEAIDHSLVWFQAPSSRRSFPFDGITHARAEASCRVMRDLVEASPSPEAFAADVARMFDVYQSVGYDGRGVVLFTGYYAPVFRASRVRTPRFTAPLYQRPDDLVTDELTGTPRGRRTASGQVVPYHTRAEIETSGMFDGRELVWLENDLDAYIVHVNGSAKLRMEDGSIMFVGYDGKTDRPYSSLGRAMIRAGLIDENEVSLASIKRVYRRNPDAVRPIMRQNESFVFFTEYDGDRWPAGSLGVPVTGEASIATDKAIYPRGGMVLADTKAITFSRGQRRFRRFMLDQDTGGAIRAPGRADLFMGIGDGAEILAGGQYAEGRLYYFFVKPEYAETAGSN